MTEGCELRIQRKEKEKNHKLLINIRGENSTALVFKEDLLPLPNRHPHPCFCGHELIPGLPSTPNSSGQGTVTYMTGDWEKEPSSLGVLPLFLDLCTGAFFLLCPLPSDKGSDPVR